MQPFKLNKIVLVGLLLLLKLTNAKAQEVINAVHLEKINASLFKVRYKLNGSYYKFNTATLKILRKRKGQVEEVFSEAIAPEHLNPQASQTYSYSWKPGEGAVQAGDELQAKIIVSYTKPAVAKQTEKQKTNAPPKADAGGDMEIQLPLNSRITLDGIKSYDEDGRIVDVNWRQVDGPSSLSIASPKSYKTSVGGDVKAGVYAFELSVKDDAGQSSSARMTITVKQASAQPTPQASASVIKKDTQAKRSFVRTYAAPKLKGGPDNAWLSLLLPGVGHFFVSGDYTGEDRNPKSFLITGLYAGAIGGAVYYKLRSNHEYNKYIDLSKFREYQRDRNGNVIGIRGANQGQASQYLEDSKNSHKNFLILTAVSAGIITADMIYTFIKGSKNKKQWNNEYNSAQTDLFISSNGAGLVAGIRIKL